MAHEGKLRKDAGLVGLLYASVGGIVGSGWLFGPLHAAQQAGPLSLGSWAIGAGAIMLLALVFAELGTIIPRSGAMVHISHISHGAALGVIWSWILFFSYVTVAPVEVMAVLTYANNYIPGLIQPDSGLLTGVGFIASALCLGVFVLLNFLVIRWVLFINSAATWWKLAVPAATVFVLIGYSYHPENLRLPAPGGGHHQLEGMFTAVATSGVIFSYFGFRQAVDLAGETARPSRNIPLAILGSVVIGLVLYLGLQLAFLLAVDPARIAAGGWAALDFPGRTGPFAAIAAIVGATWWAVILYIDAIISPGGTGFIYVTAASRITMAAGQIGSGPAALARINRSGVPWVALIVTYAAGVMFFFPFPSWQKLVSYISSVTVLSYSIGPIVLLQLRRSMPEVERPFRLWMPWLLAPAAFIVSNWIIFWTGLTTLNFMFGLLLLLFVGYVLFNFARGRNGVQALRLHHTWWIFPYFGGLWLITALGPEDAIGGNGTLSLFGGMGVVAVFSLAIMRLALATAIPQEEVRQYLDEMVELPADVSP